MKPDYRKKIEDANQNDPHHPMNKNVSMQVHHLISRKGVRSARMIGKLKQLGYDINDIDNLVSLPCTVQGACHLKVQLHRGDHTAPFDDDDNEETDDDHPMTYHRKVKSLLLKNVRMKDICDDSKPSVQRQINRLSKKMLRRIQRYNVALSSIHRNFVMGTRKGCCGKNDVDGTKKSGKPCPVTRNHYLREGPGQRKEEIEFKGTYILRVGH
jgi:hypothetical protein